MRFKHAAIAYGQNQQRNLTLLRIRHRLLESMKSPSTLSGRSPSGEETTVPFLLGISSHTPPVTELVDKTPKFPAKFNESTRPAKAVFPATGRSGQGMEVASRSGEILNCQNYFTKHVFYHKGQNNSEGPSKAQHPSRAERPLTTNPCKFRDGMDHALPLMMLPSSAFHLLCRGFLGFF